MTLKRLAIITFLLAITQTPGLGHAQTAGDSEISRPAPPAPSSSASLPPSSTNAPPRTDCDGAPCPYPQPRITVANAPPLPVAWPLRDRITWASSVVLAIVGYVGIMLALSALKKIERQAVLVETVATAAADSAQAALLNSQAILNAERPWLLVSVEPSLQVENSFVVTATNRGRSPAKIVGMAEQIKFAADEAELPETPQYDDEPSKAPPIPIIMLPGESVIIKPFCRDDLRSICDSDEQLKRIEDWEEKVFIYGKLTYRDLIAPTEKQLHETAWCCWYIHGKQKSGFVIAGPPDYNSHT